MAKVDGLSPAGAKIQAEQIEAYWARQGAKVTTRVEVSTSHGGNRIAEVRSDMINGYPRDWWTK